MASLNSMRFIEAINKSGSILILAAIFGVIGPTNACSSRASNSETVVTNSTAQTKRCEARWYSDETDYPDCFELQKRLSEAARDGDLTSVKSAIEAGANVNGVCASFLSPLNLASAGGHDDVVDVLIAHGADVNRVEGIGNTALKSAVYFQHEKVVVTLLANAADICNDVESSALDYARNGSNGTIVNLLLQAVAEKCPAKPH